MWQMLQVTDAIDREFASALNKVFPVLGWSPRMSWIGAFQSEVKRLQIPNPQLEVSQFPLQRGYAHAPIAWFSRSTSRQLARMRNVLREKRQPEKETPLICTTPYWASAAEQWSGPVVYYLTDLIAAYEGADGKLVRALDRRMCQAATLVCPNSKRLGRYLIQETGCDPERIVVIPNATRATNILSAPARAPFPLPDDARHLPRPIAGVIGNLAGNMDWTLIRNAVRLSPGFSWLFVGPYDVPMEIPEQRRARADVLAMQSEWRVFFTGYKIYGQLRDYARAFDVAVLPYFRREPTLSGSSTRFYEHLAACRPMVATPCFEELLEKEPYLKLVDTAAEVAGRLNELAAMNFDDGLTEARWMASQDGTWERRAEQMVSALSERVPEIPMVQRSAVFYAETAELIR